LLPLLNTFFLSSIFIQILGTAPPGVKNILAFGLAPTEEQNRVRTTLGNILEGVISQRLVPTLDNKRIAAMEIMLKTPRIKELILQNRDNEIKETLEEGKKIYGTQSFDQHLVDLIIDGKIDEKIALEYASNKNDFMLKLKKERMQQSENTNNLSENKFSLKEKEE
jgi:twitching motility protein PilT